MPSIKAEDMTREQVCAQEAWEEFSKRHPDIAAKVLAVNAKYDIENRDPMNSQSQKPLTNKEINSYKAAIAKIKQEHPVYAQYQQSDMTDCIMSKPLFPNQNNGPTTSAGR